jgi:hypothetical protein
MREAAFFDVWKHSPVRYGFTAAVGLAAVSLAFRSSNPSADQ